MSGYCVEVFAPAKINLHLDVLGKRDDGFHDILSLFQMISLYDRILLRLREDNEIRFKGNINIPRGENLVIMAVREVQRVSKIPFGVDIELQKEIPVGAGLGGGSSDAASVLVSLTRLLKESYGIEFKGDIIGKIALGLGSDVPFFLNGCAALVKGRGEVVIPLEARSDYEVLVVFSGVMINTKGAYEWLDNTSVFKERRKIEGIDENMLIDSYKSEPDSWQFFNSFRDVVCDRYPELAKLIEFLYDSGAIYSNLSGTGSVVFGIFTEKKIRNKAFSYLKKNYKFVKLCKPLERKRECVLKL